MLSPLALEAFERACTSIANEVAQESGFVPVRNLLDRFQAGLAIRPLLVEGMIATTNSSNAEGRASWVVLIDSETSGITEKSVQTESIDNPLPVRVRNTIAHELVHTLAFKPSQFGIKLALNSKEKNQNSFVELIEEETERLSPLLLVPDKALLTLFGSKKNQVSAEDVQLAASNLGVSRDVFISKLKSIKPTDASQLRLSTGLRNVGLGIGQWTDRSDAVLRKWPVFLNFDRNIVPTLFLDLILSDNLPIEKIHGGLTDALRKHNCFDFVSSAGINSSPRAEQMKIRFTIEQTSFKSGQRFIFSVSNIEKN